GFSGFELSFDSRGVGLVVPSLAQITGLAACACTCAWRTQSCSVAGDGAGSVCDVASRNRCAEAGKKIPGKFVRKTPGNGHWPLALVAHVDGRPQQPESTIVGRQAGE